MYNGGRWQPKAYTKNIAGENVLSICLLLSCNSMNSVWCIVAADAALTTAQVKNEQNENQRAHRYPQICRGWALKVLLQLSPGVDISQYFIIINSSSRCGSSVCTQPNDASKHVQNRQTLLPHAWGDILVHGIIYTSSTRAYFVRIRGVPGKHLVAPPGRVSLAIGPQVSCRNYHPNASHIFQPQILFSRSNPD